MVRPATMLLVVLMVAAVVAAAGSTPFSGWYSGAATFYGGPQDSATTEYNTKIATGSCGYGDIDPKLWPFYLVAGLSPSNPLIQSLKERGCGSCLEVECVGAPCHPGVGPVQALITDECAERCSSSQVNLHVFGFEMLAPTDLGTVDVRYRLIACEPVDPITIHVDAYRVTEGGWLRLALKNIGGDGQIAAVELAPAAATNLNASSTFIEPRVVRSPRARGGGLWRKANNTYGAAWELNGVPPPPLHMRITNARGQTIVIADAIPRAGVLGDIETEAQFPPLATPQAAEGTLAAPLVPPPGAYLAPGTPNVLIFHGPDPEPLPADGDAGAGAGDADAPSSPADPAGMAATVAAGEDGAQYAVAGFADDNGDGIADEEPGVIGMPDTSANATAAAASPAPVKAGPPKYVPAPSAAGGPGRRMLRQCMRNRAPA
ncbi:hypothetical protein MNEG_9055 [Monoraphidium neglectum]|uniref:Expansin-like EG45 domain-containing protein n=1 Tax=Monoraphidium neglectum TaxID=145388 RepID=A0A0D2KTX7_9CHLO|nr:hypothetical protein MNEG_9055 [Monoraphidium neglectum]KIY98908.1 hypothetical protein MNEG_9055 [Monoraphidium neglectum]|eukprot:XP_013897928.1 hypothetical protein MNEG_9055 [Monoraphidium neglectum]